MLFVGQETDLNPSDADARWASAGNRLDGFRTIHFRKAEMAIESYIVHLNPKQHFASPYILCYTIINALP